MKRSNLALRLQPSLLDKARELAESEGVALNQLIKWRSQKRFLSYVRRNTSPLGRAAPILARSLAF